MNRAPALDAQTLALREILGAWQSAEATALRDAAPRMLARHLARLDMRGLYGAEWHRQASAPAAGGNA